MKRYILYFIIIFTFANTLYAEIVNGIACKVGNDLITINEFNTAYDKAKKRATLLGEEVPLKRDVMNDLIDEILIKKEADKKGIVVNEDELERIIEDIKKQNNLSDDEFMSELKKEMLTIQELKEKYRMDILKARLINQMIADKAGTISDEEIENFYSNPANKRLFIVPGIVTISEIVISVPEDASYKEALDIKSRAVEIYERAKGGERFQDLVIAYSTSPDKEENMGDRGSFTRDQLNTFLSPDDVNLIFSLDKGDVTPPIRFKDGYHIFKIEDKTERKLLTLEEAYENIKSYIFKLKGDDLFKSWILEKREATKIQFMIEMG